ncbi:MAG: ribosome biogenesis protein [Nanoarchaeota archaeon]|nr:ribosome biogenesis protein [Nanoarchaeota archaeon]
MASNILKCTTCGSYGMSSECSCGGTRMLCKPPKYSPEDKYAKYRRMAKEQQEE